MGIDDPSLVWMKVPEKIDPDFMVKIYSLSGFKNAGLYKSITYNGNVTLDFLPTSKVENALQAFYQGTAAIPVDANAGGTCMDAMKRLLQIL